MVSLKSLMPGDDRDRGIITKVDREFLKEKKEYKSEQSERDARYRIRSRIKNSFLDFSILFRDLDKRDRDQVFSVFDDTAEDVFELSTSSEESMEDMMDQLATRMGISDALSFIYLGIKGSDGSFESVLEHAIEEAEEENGYVVQDVSITIEVKRETPDIDALFKKLREGEDLTKSEISTIMRSNKAEFDEDTMGMFFDQMSSKLSNQEGDFTFEIDSDEEGEQ